MAKRLYMKCGICCREYGRIVHHKCGGMLISDEAGIFCLECKDILWSVTITCGTCGSRITCSPNATAITRSMRALAELAWEEEIFRFRMCAIQGLPFKSRL